MVGQDVLDELRATGWVAAESYLGQSNRWPAVFAVERPLGPTVSVIVAVHQEVGRFVVWSLLREGDEMKLGQVHGERGTLPKALRLVPKACRTIDTDEADPM